MIQKISILLILLTQFTFAQDAKLSRNSLTISKVSKEALKIAKEIEEAKRSEISVVLKKTVTQEGFTRFVKKNKWITKLNIPGNGNIGALTGLEKVKGLKKIVIQSLKKSKTTPLDLGPLSNHMQLEEIDFLGTKVTNTEALSNCKSLKIISFYMSNVSSLEFLYGTPLVENLNLYGYKHTFENYDPVSSLKNIKTLDIYMNKQAVDEKLSALKNLTSLVKFSFSHCRNITKLDFLENCTELTFLNGKWTKGLKDLSALSKLTKLKTVKLDDCQASDFSILKNCVNLKYLDISGTQVTNIDFIESLVNLEILDISGTEVKNIDFIESLVNLKILDAYETPIDSISQIKNHPSLKELNISETLIKNIEFIKSLVHLEELNISKTPIASISQIKNHSNLEELNLSYTNISSIKDVMTLSKLKYINIKKTSIKNLKPLLSCPKLRNIKLDKQIHKDFIKQSKKDHPKIKIY